MAGMALIASSFNFPMVMAGHLNPLNVHLNPLTVHLNPLNVPTNPLTVHLNPLNVPTNPLTVHLNPLNVPSKPLSVHLNPLNVHPQVMAGRVITGVGVGLGFTSGALYGVEIAPANDRGAVTSFIE
eukprot:5592628-Pyramimonas_sp.AAC.1